MLEESVSEINLCDNENDVFRNCSQKPNLTPLITDDRNFTRDPSYTQFKPVVSKSFTVSVDKPEKVGDGRSTFVIYHVHFEGLAPPFIGIKSSVVRRFSDFIYIHEKLVAKHLPNGIIVPPAPGKELLDTTRLKLSKNVYLENEFVERRRLALKRYLSRLFKHPVISSDKDLLDFIQHTDSPRNYTQLISSTTAKRFIKNLGDAFGKAAYQIDDSDDPFVDETYFYAKTEELAAWERQLKRLRSALAALGTAEQELSSTKFAESRALTSLANIEEHTGLARALVRLSETQEEIGQVHATLANSHVVYLVECVADLLDLIQACKDALAERVKAYRSFQNTAGLLQSKRLQKVSLELTGKADQKKLDQLNVEIDKLVNRMDEEKTHFDEISKTVKSELERFSVNRFIDIKKAAVKHLEVMLCAQSKLLGFWETYLTHARSIA